MKPNHVLPDASPAYRKTLAEGLFYKVSAESRFVVIAASYGRLCERRFWISVRAKHVSGKRETEAEKRGSDAGETTLRGETGIRHRQDQVAREQAVAQTGGSRPVFR